MEFEAVLGTAMLVLGALAAGGGALGAIGVRARLLHRPGRRFAIIGPSGRGSPEMLFMSLHGLLRPPLRRLLNGQPHLSLEIAGRGGRVSFEIWIPQGERDFVEAMLKSAFPGLQLAPIASAAREASPCQATGQLKLACGNQLPIRTAFESEPLSALFWTLARAERDEEVTLQLLVRPTSSAWQTRAHLAAYRLRRGPPRGVLPGIARDPAPTSFERARAKAIEEKSAFPGFACVLRVRAATRRSSRASELVRSVAASLGPYAGANAFALRSRHRGDRIALTRERFPLFGHFVLNARELGVLWHLPSESPPQLEVVRSPVLPPPVGADAGERELGVTPWAANSPVRLSIADSRYHLHLLGSTGTGKTTMLLNLATQDILAGRGVGVLDPKGDLVRGLLERIPRERVEDVVLISPDDSGTSVGINPLELWPGDDVELVADNALTIFKRIYERYWGPRTDDVLKSALLTLLRRPGSHLAQIPLLLTDPVFRRRTTKVVRDPLGLDGFWRWFEQQSEAQRGEAIGPVLNKLRDFLLRPRLRRLLCQPRSTVDLRQVVDSGKILLADLSVGRWGDTTAALIGSFLVARLWQAVLARSATQEERRADFFLFVDEFQHFIGVAGPFADVLAEARSLRLSLTIANQHLGQLTRDLREAVASNARSRMVFQCGQDDATYLAREFAPLDATALMSLGRFEAAARLSIEGRSSTPFTVRTLAPREVSDVGVALAVRLASAQRFGRPVGVIDDELEASVASRGRPGPNEAGNGARP